MAATLERGWPGRQVISDVHLLWRQLNTRPHTKENISISTKHLPRMGGLPLCPFTRNSGRANGALSAHPRATAAREWSPRRLNHQSSTNTNWEGGNPLAESSACLVRRRLSLD